MEDVSTLMMIQTDGRTPETELLRDASPFPRDARRDETSEQANERTNPPLVVVVVSPSSLCRRRHHPFETDRGGAVRVGAPLSTYPRMCIQYYLHVIPISTYFY